MTNLFKQYQATLDSADQPKARKERSAHQEACKRAFEDRKREYPLVGPSNFEVADDYQKFRIEFWMELLHGKGREYRKYSNILWGRRYHPDTKAHHCRADDAEAAAKVLRINDADGFQSMQVFTGDRWQWVTDVPVHLGGISKHWHGERV